jgi:hypothetical protein
MESTANGPARTGTGERERRGGRRAVAATGLIASAAAFGVSASAADASTIFACYKKSSDALSYSKSHKCKKGSKLISWNSQGPQGATGAAGAKGAQGAAGPQGAKGAQGPQGPAGAVAGYANERFSGSSLTSGAHVVAALTPASSGEFEVNAMATIGAGGGNWQCWAQSSSGGKTPEAENLLFGTARTQTIETTGILPGGPTSSIVEVCNVSPKSGSKPTVFDSALTAVRLSAAHVTTSVTNKFNKASSAARPGAAPR